MVDAALVGCGVADVEESVPRIKIHEDSNASGSMSTQRHHHYRAVSIEVDALVKDFVRTRIELESQRIDRREFLRVRGNDVAFGLNGGIGCELQLFLRQENRE